MIPVTHRQGRTIEEVEALVAREPEGPRRDFLITCLEIRRTNERRRAELEAGT